ncbi:MAG: MBL fold metallo-hydrolase [Candidatus Aminicenantes bacterium]|nr:MBL fold metallo-hydrolase [Candidatus Aminicenantes bacterium]
MNKRKTFMMFVGAPAVLLSSVWPASAQETKEIQVKEINPGLFVLIGPGGNGNAAFLATKEGVLVVDAGQSPEIGGRIMSIIREKTDLPVRYIVITHYHSDHTYGLQSFPETAVVVSSQNCFKNMATTMTEELRMRPERLEGLRRSVERLRQKKSLDLEKEGERLEASLRNYEAVKDVRVVLPEIAFDGKLVLHLGGETVEIHHPGATHTSGSSLVYFPERKTVHMGDMLFAASHAYIDWQAGSNTKNWISYLKSVAGCDIETVIPGHGNVSSRDELKKASRYLENLWTEVKAARERGLTLEEAQKNVTMQTYKSLPWAELLPLNIETVYRELEREESPVRVHYLGHASFVLEFDNGVKILADYGKSRSYGLGSPIHGPGDLRPDVATYSHGHEDHAGGARPEGIRHVLKDGRALSLKGVEIVPIPTHERSLDNPDNTSYLFIYKGLKVLHLGDCQALIMNAGKPEIPERIRKLYPDTYDLVFMPIGFVTDISASAAAFANLLDARRIVPMHYWSPEEKERFLELVEGKNRTSGGRYRIRRAGSPVLFLRPQGGEDPGVLVISLDPGPYDR